MTPNEDSLLNFAYAVVSASHINFSEDFVKALEEKVAEILCLDYPQ